jgi:hypothetical protein
LTLFKCFQGIENFEFNETIFYFPEIIYNFNQWKQNEWNTKIQLKIEYNENNNENILINENKINENNLKKKNPLFYFSESKEETNVNVKFF